MGKLLAGLALASAGWAIAWQLGPGFTSAPCRDLCGEGTTCVDERCVVEAPAIEQPAEDAPEAGTKKRKRRRRGKRRRGGASTAEVGESGDEQLPPFEPVSDKHIPPYRDKTVNLDLYGSERLSDARVDQHMGKLTSGFQRCITTAAMYSDKALGAGALTFKIRLLPTGKVEGVTARAPANLKVFGIVPCARKVVYAHRFPTYDGPPMGVDFSFDVD